MEEKERYEIHIYDDICVDLYDNGVLDKSINDTYKLEKLLNQQSKRLKELEQENQQLKNQARKAYREGLLQKQFDKDMEIQELKYKIEQLKQSQKQLTIDELKNDKLATPCIICGEYVELSEEEAYQRIVVKVCDKCKQAVMKMRETIEHEDKGE